MIPLEILLILVCMTGEAFFSGIETGVISIHRVRLRHLVEEGSRKARILKGFADRTDRLLGTTLVGTNICIVAVSVLSASMATRLAPTWGKAVSSAVMTVLLLIFSEYMPKAWFQSRPLERCSIFADTLQAASVVLRPISALVLGITGLLIPKSNKGLTPHQPFVTREDLKMLTSELGQHGVLSDKEHVMIHRVFEMSSRTVAEIMIPREKMVVLQAGADYQEVIRVARETGMSRFPVYDGTEKKFIGIASARHAVSVRDTGEQSTAADFAHPAQMLPETTPVDDVLPRMKRFRQPMCLVANNAGEVTGLVTREDVLEEIVGML